MIMKEERDLAEDPTNSSKQAWLDLIPKAQKLAEKESETPISGRSAEETK